MLQHTVKAVVRPGERSGYVAACVELPVVTQGATLDEVIANLKDAVTLALEGEDAPPFRVLPPPRPCPGPIPALTPDRPLRPDLVWRA